MLRNVIAIVLAVFFIHIKAEDPDAPHQQYLKAFEDLPALFEHIIEMLQEKPEILEKNDVTTFLEFAAANDGDVNSVENGFNVFKRESKLEDVDDKNRDAVEGYDWYLFKADSNFEGFVGSFPGDFQLTADEVAERMLMVERKLEDYYNETN